MHFLTPSRQCFPTTIIMIFLLLWWICLIATSILTQLCSFALSLSLTKVLDCNNEDCHSCRQWIAQILCWNLRSCTSNGTHWTRRKYQWRSCYNQWLIIFYFSYHCENIIWVQNQDHAIKNNIEPTMDNVQVAAEDLTREPLSRTNMKVE